MKKWISILSGLLIAQLVLAAVFNLTGDEYGAFQAQDRLLAFDKEVVDGLRVGDGENSLLLERRDGTWLLPQSGDYPANQASVDKLLEDLGGMKKGWPVATTSGAARRFRVADDQFERKLELLSGEDTIAELYVGTSPGFRKVHARPADEDAVFATTFNTWEASPKADDWIDKTLLALDDSQVVRVQMPDFVLHREEEGALTITELADGEETNPVAARTFLKKLTELRIQSVLATELKPEYRQQAPMLEVKVARKDGGDLNYRFSKPAEASYYVLKRSDHDYYFKVAEFAVDPIKDTTREKLLQAPAEKASQE